MAPSSEAKHQLGCRKPLTLALKNHSHLKLRRHVQESESRAVELILSRFRALESFDVCRPYNLRERILSAEPAHWDDDLRQHRADDADKPLAEVGGVHACDGCHGMSGLRNRQFSRGKFIP